MSYPHQTLLQKNGIAVTDLPEKTQKAIDKFATETDDDKREALDEKIFGDVEDFLEAKAAKEKAEKKKAAHAAAKAEAEAAKKKGATGKGIDVSTAPTAANATQKQTDAAAAAKPKRFMDTMLGRKA